MTFTSLTFFIFLATLFAIYYAASFSGFFQLALLVVASGVFYAWDNPRLLLLLIAVGLLAGTASFAIDRIAGQAPRMMILTASIASLLGVLGFFKYGGLFYETLAGAGRNPQWEKFFLGIPLPIGISFYVFHAISLLVDVHRGLYRPARGASLAAHLTRTGFYISFFPQLIAGPIAKARFFYPQIARKTFADIDCQAVLHCLVLGYFLKLVVADNLAVETLKMSRPFFEALPGRELVMLMLAYSCQIFADFFGYSLMAMGFAALFGYKLPQNFNRPYIAASFSEFWQRWHMSLSAWLRDYLYIPLGGSHKGKLRTYMNLFIVMFLGGLWHGAAWSFAIWGSLHGAALAIERPFLGSALYRSEQTAARMARMGLVFCVVTLAWLFFRLGNYTEAFAYLGAMGRHLRAWVPPRTQWNIFIYCLPVLAYHALPLVRGLFDKPLARTSAYAVMLFLIITNSGVPGAFIYFRF